MKSRIFTGPISCRKPGRRFISESRARKCIVNYALSVGGMDLSAFFSVKDGAIRISFRSKKFDVNNFARTHFNGGGHINAAGAKSMLSLDDTVKKFIDLLPQYKSALKK